MLQLMRTLLLKSAGMGALVASAICGLVGLVIWALLRQNGEWIWMTLMLPPVKLGLTISDWLGIEVIFPVAVLSTILTGALIGIVIGLIRPRVG